MHVLVGVAVGVTEPQPQPSRHCWSSQTAPSPSEQVGGEGADAHVRVAVPVAVGVNVGNGTNVRVAVQVAIAVGVMLVGSWVGVFTRVHPASELPTAATRHAMLTPGCKQSTAGQVLKGLVPSTIPTPATSQPPSVAASILRPYLRWLSLSTMQLFSSPRSGSFFESEAHRNYSAGT